MSENNENFIRLKIPICVSPQKCFDLGSIQVDQMYSIPITLRCELSNIEIKFEAIESEEKSTKIEPIRTLRIRKLPAENKVIIKLTPIYPTVETIIRIRIIVSPLKTVKSESLLQNVISDEITIRYKTQVSNWINPQQASIELIEKIGEGKEGKIFRGKYNGEEVAIKKALMADGRKENELFAFLKNDYIIKYICSYRDESLQAPTVNIVMELAPFGCLLSKYREISEEVLLKISEDVAKAIRYLHVEKHIIHRDVKPQNILLFNWTDIVKINAKLTDFGISRIIDSGGLHTGMLGTQNFTAPEVIRNERYSYPCDIYSLGMTMYFSFTKIDPYDESISKVMSHGNSIPKHPLIVDNIWSLITSCCELDQNKRPNIETCLEHIEQIRKEYKILSSNKVVEIEQKEVYFSLGKPFDLLESVIKVVESINKYDTQNQMILAYLKLKNHTDIEEAIKILENDKITIDNHGDKEYLLGDYYFKSNDKNVIRKGRDLLIKAASKNQPQAIMFLVDQLKDIANQKILIIDDKKNESDHFEEFMQKVCRVVPTKIPLQVSKGKVLRMENNEKYMVSPECVIKMFASLKSIFPICKFQYAIAQLLGIGTPKNITNADILFVQLQKINCEEALFYEALCQLTPHHTQEQHKTTFQILSDYLLNSKHCELKPDVLNNQAVFLFKGWGRSLDKRQSFKMFSEAKKLGNIEALYNLSYCLLHGEGCEGTEKEKKTAIKLLLKAAKKGYIPSQLLLGNCYFNGIGTLKDEKSAVYWYTKAALQNNSTAINNLGSCFYKGNGVEKNDQFAFHLFLFATQMGNQKAQINLALCYLWGCGVKKSIDDAKKCYEIASLNSNSEAQSKYAQLLLDEYRHTKNEETLNEALNMLDKASKNGNADAMYNYGLCFYKGFGHLKKNQIKAFDLFKAAAFKKHPDSLYILGVMYYKGKYVFEDKTLAMEYITKAAELHNHRALFHIGMCFFNGIGKPLDVDKAMEFFDEAAKYGSIQAELKIAGILLHGSEKIQADKPKAIRIYESLAKKRVGEAYYMLGECSLNGDGVQKDVGKARNLFQMASLYDCPMASERLVLLDHNIF
ncbi:hypothetical protein EDI_044060 [Entamoeba dispar SAW760]|uniref:Protein kinase domain-containing protein n=1 Tax=Entamoeba dispar (strain ATCC PRA-260 / SAW760) TaxID=370354 RepID=B0EHQ6_ENTDS|nr:uncharacterized protein EDI_044060 [Entamoeba dispar SAW760]EDR25850.1 hypothetical protein EDI_044060 [Entamoeba dispar SAW760]|eukprot:EDR25850.1 hypothetical protein EDI_044060 [Entamoeba dispar SAW760]